MTDSTDLNSEQNKMSLHNYNVSLFLYLLLNSVTEILIKYF